MFLLNGPNVIVFVLIMIVFISYYHYIVFNVNVCFHNMTMSPIFLQFTQYNGFFPLYPYNCPQNKSLCPQYSLPSPHLYDFICHGHDCISSKYVCICPLYDLFISTNITLFGLSMSVFVPNMIVFGSIMIVSFPISIVQFNAVDDNS